MASDVEALRQGSEIFRSLSVTADSPATGSATETIEYRIGVFTTQARTPDSAFIPYGTLKLGTKQVAGATYYAAFFRGPTVMVHNQRIASVEHEISRSIMLMSHENDSSRLVFRKVSDPYTQFTFEITIENFGRSDAHFLGSLTTDSGETFDWEGTQVSWDERQEEQAEISIHRPADAQGTIQQLININPIIDGVDRPRVLGDKVMGKIMMHALDEETKRIFLPDLEALTDAEQKILEENSEFLNRAGIHALSEQFREMKQVGERIRKGIKPKYQLFLEMLTTPPPMNGERDPARDYGWDRAQYQDQINRLRKQYINVVAACYREGYKAHCSLWNKFLKHPVYWFRVYEDHLKRRENMEQWRAIVANSNTENVTSPHQVLQTWANKLSMLKSEAPASEANTLDIEGVIRVFNEEANETQFEAQIIDDAMASRVREFTEHMQSTETPEFRQAFQSRSQSFHDAYYVASHDVVTVISRLANHDSLYIEAQKYWCARNPPGFNGKLTIAQMIKYVEQSEEVIPLTLTSERSSVSETSSANSSIGGSTLTDRCKQIARRWSQSFGRVFRILLHVGAFFGLLKHFSSPETLSHAELGRTICAFTAEIINAVGFIGKRVLSKMWTKGRIYHNALRWFSDALQGLGSNLRRRTTNAMIGSVGNLVRTVCIIGCIFELYTSFWELHSACYSTIPDQFVRIAYAGFKFALTCIETAAIGLGIGAEILGHVTLAAVCGYVGIAIALVGIVAGIAYITWGPQPDTPVEKFLNDHLRDIGGYLPEAEPEPVKEWLEDLWKELKKPAQFPLGN